ncbi:translationally-controlled tumor protein homolog [Trichonephila clavipes]|nr:translationally-controlled tumor protein homolog [Trichonephila clavipes]
MFTDTFKFKLVNDCLYEVECAYVTRNTPCIELEGSNPVEVGDKNDDIEDINESGFDLVLNQRLVETTFNTKNDFRDYLKIYSKELEKKWKTSGAPAEVIDASKQNFINAVKLLVPKFKDFRFYLGESCNPLGLVAMLEFRDDSGTEKPVMIFIKEGLCFVFIRINSDVVIGTESKLYPKDYILGLSQFSGERCMRPFTFRLRDKEIITFIQIIVNSVGISDIGSRILEAL